MGLVHFIILINDTINNNPDVVPEHSPFIILYITSYVCMTNDDKDTKHTRDISRGMHFVINVEECNLHNKIWCEVGLQLVNIGTNNAREDEINTGL